MKKVAFLLVLLLSVQVIAQVDSTLYKKFENDMKQYQSVLLTKEKEATNLGESCSQLRGALQYLAAQANSESTTIDAKIKAKQQADSTLYKKYVAEFTQVQSQLLSTEARERITKEEVGQLSGIILYCKGQLDQIVAAWKQKSSGTK